MSKSLTLFFGLILGAGLVFFGRTHQSTPPKDQDLLMVPQAKGSRLLSLGHPEALASALWMKSLVYYGDNVLQGREAKWMIQMMNVITTLDSSFAPAYNLVGSVMTSEDDLDLQILDRGIKHLPQDWRLRLFYAFKLIEKHQDYPNAAAILAPLEKDPNPKIPPHIRTLHLTLANYGLPKEIAIADALQNYMSQGELFHERNQAMIARRIFYDQNYLYTRPKAQELEQVKNILNFCSDGTLSPQECLDKLISLKTQKKTTIDK